LDLEEGGRDIIVIGDKGTGFEKMRDDTGLGRGGRDRNEA
jgi:hypothetical protein